MGAHKGQYGFMRGSIRVHMSRLLRVQNHKQYQPGYRSIFITILVKHVIRIIMRLQDNISCQQITFYRELRSAYHITQSMSVVKQGYQYHDLLKGFSQFFHRHSELFVQYNICLKTLLQQGILEVVFSL